jgi:hypothetical protein
MRREHWLARTDSEKRMRLYRTAIKVRASRLIQRWLTAARRYCQTGFSNLLRTFTNSASRSNPLRGKSAALVCAYFESGDFHSRHIRAQSLGIGFTYLERRPAD